MTGASPVGTPTPSLTDFEPRTLTLSPAEWAQTGTPGLKVGDGGESPREGLR